MMSGAMWVRDTLAAAGWTVQVAHARKVRDRRSLDDVQAEIAADEEAQRAAVQKARKRLREQRRAKAKEEIRAKIDQLKAKLKGLG